MGRQASKLGTAQKVACSLIEEDFGKTAQAHQDCLDGLGQTVTEGGEVINSKAVLALWVTQIIRQGLARARKAGKEAREAQEKIDEAEEVSKHANGLACHFGLSADTVLDLLEQAEAENQLSKPRTKC